MHCCPFQSYSFHRYDRLMWILIKDGELFYICFFFTILTDAVMLFVSRVNLSARFMRQLDCFCIKTYKLSNVILAVWIITFNQINFVSFLGSYNLVINQCSEYIHFKIVFKIMKFLNISVKVFNAIVNVCWYFNILTVHLYISDRTEQNI